MSGLEALPPDWIVCPNCQGDGWFRPIEPEDDEIECFWCWGEGRVPPEKAEVAYDELEASE